MFYPLQIRTLLRSVQIPAPRREVFDFFSEAGNLDRLTPEWLNFQILTPPPIKMRPGTRINYRMSLHRIRFRWTTEIKLWEPPRRFIDEQIKGPYLYWSHEHGFEESGSGTRMTDHVRYAVPGFVFEPVLHLGFVRNRLRRIFDFREQALLDVFGRGEAGKG
jgi:ligand-binding SRPBCC domain-containing protein